MTKMQNKNCSKKQKTIFFVFIIQIILRKINVINNAISKALFLLIFFGKALDIEADFRKWRKGSVKVKISACCPLVEMLQ